VNLRDAIDHLFEDAQLAVLNEGDAQKLVFAEFGLYNAIHNLSPRGAHTLARLKRLFHEWERLPATSKVLLRPDYQWRYAHRPKPGPAQHNSKAA
jgi:hypothetical protein